MYNIAIITLLSIGLLFALYQLITGKLFQNEKSKKVFHYFSLIILIFLMALQLYEKLRIYF